MTTMEMSATTNGSTIPTEPSLLNALPPSSKAAASPESPHLNGNSTVCYLANGSGQIDRLNLVLPLTSSSTIAPSPLPLPALSPEAPFTSQHGIEPALTQAEYCSDSDRTPVNKEKDFLFSPTSISQSSSFSSCRTVDSGTESICSDATEDYMSDLASDRILKFFASDNSKSNRFAGRRPTSGNIRQTSTEDDEEDLYSDESTLSESSVSPQDFASNPVMITPESVVAAIDAKIKQRQSRNALVTGDKDTEGGIGAADSTNNDDIESSRVHPDSPSDADTTIPISELKPIDDGDRAAESAGKFRSEIEDDLAYDEDDDDCPPVRLIRSTSLKTGKTPPGTPRGKKIVRFADALGLDLESVRHIVDDVPYMPPLAAFNGLKLDDEDKQWLFRQHNQPPPVPSPAVVCPLPLSSSAITKPNLRVLFCQPSSDPGPFLERVRSHKVCLENCMVSGPSGPADMFTITCIIRVLNLGFEKSVMLRYTTNEWLTWTDVLASYIPNSCDGFSDKFTVTFHVAVNSNGHQSMMPGQRLLFALKYLANSTQEHWDNNMGMNYALIYTR